MEQVHKEFPLDDFGCLCTFEHELHERIAELEGAVQGWIKLRNESIRRAEKAEAEVERLRGDLEEVTACGTCDHCWQLATLALSRRVNPSGDTLGRKERDDG